MTAMRAKVKITGIKPYPEVGEVSSEALTFSFPAKDSSYPADGSDEDQQFAKFTPNAALSMTISNPNLVGKFAVGDVFYLDFVPVDNGTGFNPGDLVKLKSGGPEMTVNQVGPAIGTETLTVWVDWWDGKKHVSDSFVPSALTKVK